MGRLWSPTAWLERIRDKPRKLSNDHTCAHCLAQGIERPGDADFL